MAPRYHDNNNVMASATPLKIYLMSHCLSLDFAQILL